MMPEQKIDTTTCWYDQLVVDEMNRFYDIHRYNPETSWHFDNFSTLLKCITDREDPKLFPSTLIDLGCGTGQLQDYCQGVEYWGADLPHIIDGCFLRNYPKFENRNFKINIVEDKISFVGGFDIAVMNGFIDVMQYPLEMMEKVLTEAYRYVIIHRQEITQHGVTRVEKNGSYGGKTFHSFINRDDFNFLIERKGFEIIKEEKLDFANWENGGSSFLLRKTNSYTPQKD